MSNVSMIEYPTRAALVAALVELRRTPGVEEVSVVDLGRTLQVVTADDAVLEAPEATETPAEPPVATLAPNGAAEASESTTETDEESADEDLIGDAPKKKGRR